MFKSFSNIICPDNTCPDGVYYDYVIHFLIYQALDESAWKNFINNKDFVNNPNHPTFLFGKLLHSKITETNEAYRYYKDLQSSLNGEEIVQPALLNKFTLDNEKTKNIFNTNINLIKKLYSQRLATFDLLIDELENLTQILDPRTNNYVVFRSLRPQDLPNSSDLTLTPAVNYLNSVLTFNYSYTGLYEEKDSVINWFRYTNASGANETLIPGITGNTYQVTASDVNKFIRTRVIPKDIRNNVGVIDYTNFVEVKKIYPVIVTPISLPSVEMSSVLHPNNIVGEYDVPGTFRFNRENIIASVLGVNTVVVEFVPTANNIYETVSTEITYQVVNQPPKISDLMIVGNHVLGQTLTVQYTATNTSSTSIEWIKNDIVISTNLTYAINSNDIGQIINVRVTPLYNTVVGNTVLSTNSSIVQKATPTISTISATSIFDGQTLNSSVITGTASVQGIFVFKTPMLSPGIGTRLQEVVFTPADQTNYLTVTTNVNVTVNKKIPQVTNILLNGSFIVNQTITVTYDYSGSLLETNSTIRLVDNNNTFIRPVIGKTFLLSQDLISKEIGVAIVPNDGVDTGTEVFSTYHLVSKISPIISNVTVSNIIDGQPLSTSIITGNANYPGVFTFVNPASLLPIGISTVSVTFTPTDTLLIEEKIVDVAITILAKKPVFSAVTISGNAEFDSLLTGIVQYDAANSSFSQGTHIYRWVRIANNVETIISSENTYTTQNNDVLNQLVFEAKAIDSENNQGDWQRSNLITIQKINPVITWPTVEVIHRSNLNTAVLPTGFSFVNSNQVMNGVGTFDVQAIYTPTNTIGYNILTNNVQVTVLPILPVISDGIYSNNMYGAPINISYSYDGSYLETSNEIKFYRGSTEIYNGNDYVPVVADVGNLLTVTVTVIDSMGNISNELNITIPGIIKADLVLETVPSLSNIIIGELLSTSIISGGVVKAGTVTIPGVFSFINPNAILPLGTQVVAMQFTPTDNGYNNILFNGSVIVEIVQPSATNVDYTGNLNYLQTLTGTYNYSGTNPEGVSQFNWHLADDVTGLNKIEKSIDAVSYIVAQSDVSKYVAFSVIAKDNAGNVSTEVMSEFKLINKTDLTVDTLPTGQQLNEGEALSASTLSGGIVIDPSNGNVVNGEFTWANPDVIPAVGITSYSVIFTPTLIAVYNVVSMNVSVTVTVS